MSVFSSPRARRTVLLISLVPVVVALSAWGASKRPPIDAKKGAPAAPVPVLMARVAQKDVDEDLFAIGTVQPGASVTVKARVDGQLQQVLFREGQEVPAGTVLARIDPRSLQAQFDQVKAQKARNEALLENARLDLTRYADLLKLDSVSPQTYESQRAQVAQLEAAVQGDAAQLELARVQLGYTTITAPISGRTGARLVDAGNLVRASEATQIVVLNQVDTVALGFTLSEDAYARVSKAIRDAGDRPLPVEAYGRDGGELLGSGELVMLNNQIDSASGTLQLKAQCRNLAHKLWPGQFVNVKLKLGARKGVQVVPATAVQRGPDGTFVYVVGDDGSVKQRPVSVTALQNGDAIIGKGLKPGEQIVVDGHSKLRPGARVTDVRRVANDGGERPAKKRVGGAA